jgi:hypothetical protein
MASPVTEESVQAAFISYLKSQPTLTSQFTGVSGTEIREYQWQGADFVYPALRIYVDVMPSINGCGTDTVKVCLEVFSEQKSSLQAKHISGTLVELLHKKRFKAGGLDFPMVRVVNTDRADRTIYAWKCRVNLECLVNNIGAINARN